MRVLALVVLAGCKQVFGLADPQLHGDADAAADDATVQLLDASGSDASVSLACDAQDATLVGCFDFENAVVDLSSSNLAVAVSDVAFDPGKLGLAVRANAMSTMRIAQSSALAINAVTMEAWIRPEQLPGPGTRYGVWDTDGSFGLFVMEDGSVLCNPQSGARTAGGLIAPNQWRHVACGFDATMLYIYVDGVLVHQVPGGNIGTGTANGSAIGGNAPSGDHFIGRIDSLRIYRTVRTQAQVCESAGC